MKIFPLSSSQCSRILAVLLLASSFVTLHANAQVDSGVELRALEDSALDAGLSDAASAGDSAEPTAAKAADAPAPNLNPLLDKPEPRSPEVFDDPDAFRLTSLILNDPDGILEVVDPKSGKTLKVLVREKLIGVPVTIESIVEVENFATSFFNAKEFHLAKLTFNEEEDLDEDAGTLTMHAAEGRFGDFRFKEKDGKTDYKERFYSSEQLLRTLSAYVQPSSRFDYARFREAMISINDSPSLTLGANIVRAQNPPEDNNQAVDIEFVVEEKRPLYLALELNNSGRLETEHYRGIASLQYANLWKKDHVLTLSAPFAIPDGEAEQATLFSGALGYSLPWEVGKHSGGLSVFGGYSTIDVAEIAQNEPIGLDGVGSFGGGRGFYRLMNNDDRLLNLTVGLNYRSSRDEFVIDGQTGGSDAKDIDLLPFAVGLVYSDKRPISLGGRFFATVLSIYNLGDAAGVTKQDAVNTQRLEGDLDYFIQKAQFAYLRPVVPFKGGLDWYLFGRLDSHYSPHGLVPAEQFAAGGISSVRGYPNRDIVGDFGAALSLEVRTPIYDGMFQAEESTVQDKVQFVPFFFDAAVLGNNEVGDEVSESNREIYSVGAGLRYSMFKNFQLRLDYGFPLEDTDTVAYIRQSDGSDNAWFEQGGGRLHFSMQFQYSF